MSKKSKGIIAFLVFLIIVVVAFLCYTYAVDDDKTKSLDTKTSSSELTQNAIENNVVNNTVNTNNNVVSQNNIVEDKNVVAETPQKNEIEEPVAEENSEIQQDNEEEKAISIVKKDWGNTKGMAFKVEQINADGTYVISVRNEDSIALEWYTVNPKKGTFTK